MGIKTEVEDGFLLPAKDQIEALITDRTRCLLMTNPGNPTGKVYLKEEIVDETILMLLEEGVI